MVIPPDGEGENPSSTEDNANEPVSGLPPSSEVRSADPGGASETRDNGPHGNADDSDDRRVARREALKKAAVGGTVAGAVWMAPKVEGLSLVPDYASAGTAATNTINFRINSTDNNNSGDGNNYYATDNDRNNRPSGLNGCTPGTDWLIAVQPQNPGIAITPSFPANNQNQNVRMTAPLGAAGNATVNIPSGKQGDLNQNYTINVVFAIDPPWNKCRVASVSGNRCNGNAMTVNTINNPAPGATNPSSPFTVGVVVGPQPSNFGHLDIKVKCD